MPITTRTVEGVEMRTLSEDEVSGRDPGPDSL
jgi:hypothetical protein